MEKERNESKILGQRGIKFKEKIKEHQERVRQQYDYNKGKQINLHVDRETEKIYLNSLKPKFKNNGINITPNAGVFIIKASDIVADALFYEAEQLGVNPIDYSLERLEVILNIVNNNNERKQKSIKSLVEKRKNTINIIDESHTAKLNSMIKTR